VVSSINWEEEVPYKNMLKPETIEVKNEVIVPEKIKGSKHV
jgi:hypothetical protein